jgi:hypothetical protein
MSFITLRALCLLGIAVAISSPAASEESKSCASAGGPVANGAKGTAACINTGNLRCPGKGSTYECRNGHWICAYAMGGDPNKPCPSGEAGAWVWTSGQGLHRP